MTTQDELTGLIDGLYDAALDAGRWPAALRATARALGSHAALLAERDARSFAPLWSVSADMDPDLLDEYGAYFHRLDHWARVGVRLPDGAVAMDDDLTPDEASRNPEFSDLTRRYGVSRMISGHFLESPSSSTAVSFYRSEQDEPFDGEARALMRALMPHLGKALLIRRRLAMAEMREDAANEVLERIPTALLLLGAEGRILEMNGRAETIVSGRDGLSVVDRRLRAARADDDATLQALVRRNVVREAGQPVPSGGTTIVHRPSMKRPFVVVVAPPGGGRDSRRRWFDGCPPPALVFVTDPEVRPEIPVEIAARLYGLTPGEARLALALMHGASLADAANRLGITRGTAKVVLGRVFQKTGTHRQGALIARMWADLSGPVAGAG